MTDYRTKFKKTDGSKYFGSIEVESGSGSLNSTYNRFNVTGNPEDYGTEANSYPLGIEKPLRAGEVPLEAWKAAVEKLHSLEKGKDY